MPADLCKTEIGQFQAVTRKEDVILRFDIAMDDPVLMCIRERGERLPGKIERRCRRNAPHDPVSEGLDAELHRNDELIVDETRIVDLENVRVIELERDLHFVQEIFVADSVAEFRDLESDARVQDRVRCPIHIRERTRGDPPENSVFTKLLPRA